MQLNNLNAVFKDFWNKDVIIDTGRKQYAGRLLHMFEKQDGKYRYIMHIKIGNKQIIKRLVWIKSVEVR